MADLSRWPLPRGEDWRAPEPVPLAARVAALERDVEAVRLVLEDVIASVTTGEHQTLLLSLLPPRRTGERPGG